MERKSTIFVCFALYIVVFTSESIKKPPTGEVSGLFLISQNSRFSGIRFKIPKKLLLLRYLRYCVMVVYLKVRQR